jgi:hypothetical protein
MNSENQSSVAHIKVTAFNHSSTFSFSLLLSEGRAGEACEHTNKVTP